MAKTLANIQKGARFHAKNDQLVVTNGFGLTAVNAIYRRVANALPWPELRVTEDSADATATGTKTYAWATTNVFIDIKSIEVGTTSSDAAFNLLLPPPTESDWSEMAKDANTVPVYYVRFRIGSTDKIEIRPAPNYTGGTLRFIGIIEPSELTTEASVTIFQMKTADDVVEHLVAADDLIARNKTDEAEVQFDKATRILRKIFGDEKVPAELVKDIVQ